MQSSFCSYCRICLGVTRVLQGGPGAPVYYSCVPCRYIFLDGRFRVSPEEEKKRYESHDNTLENEGYVNMFREFIRVGIEPFLGGDFFLQGKRKALDFGCGWNSVLGSLLKEKGLQVDTYDPYFAPERQYLRRKYHLITATEVFEHLANPLETLRSLAGCLAPGGILALTTLFHPGEEDFYKWWYRRDPTHISFYQPETFKYLAGRAGLDLVGVDGKKTCTLQRPGAPGGA